MTPKRKLRGNAINNRKRRLLNQIFATSFAITVLLLILLGGLSNTYTTGVLERQAHKADTMYLKHTADTIDKQLFDIQVNVMQLLSTPLFNSEFEQPLHTGQEETVLLTQQITPLLSAFLLNNKYIEDLSLYLQGVGMISSSYGLNRVEFIRDRELLDEQLRQPMQSRWYNGIFSYRVTTETKSGVTLINKFPYNRSEPLFGLMLASIDSKTLKAALGSSTLFDDQFLLILNDNGSLIANSKDSSLPTSLVEAIHKATDHKSQAQLTYDGKKYFISSVISDHTKWKYVDVIPQAGLNRESRGIVIMTAALIGVLLLLAAIASFLGSRRIYRPIDKLLTMMDNGEDTVTATNDIDYALSRWEQMQSSEKQLRSTTAKLQEKQKQHIPLLRETVLLQLLQGHYQHYSEAELRKLLSRYELPLSSVTAVFAIAFDRPDGHTGKFRVYDKDLILFAMKNIVEDLLRASSFSGIASQLPSDTLVVVVWPKEIGVSQSQQNQLLFQEADEFAEQIRSFCETYLQMPVTIGVGGGTEFAKELPMLYDQASLALDSRILRGRNQVLHPNKALSSAGRYPIELESRYEHALKTGNREDAEMMLFEFADYLRGLAGTAESVLTFYTQLLAATMRTAYDVKFEGVEQLGDNEPFIIIRRLKSMDELNEWFIEQWIAPITDYIRNHTEADYTQMVEQAITFIRAEFKRDISLNDCADHCGVSTSHFTRQFRRLTGLSFLDYVTQYRIDKAKELLRETDLPIAVISEAVGYQRVNFMRVFKKLEGITPNQYRQQ
ncbi:MAG: transcriptional regulator, AraC family protein [Paenibacillaceae bacterium]|jgi:AraC-like DNA-binding protein|nr:transcriptional regulator, AraC family protein [Paenibacillaceae bacterium]